MCVFVGASPGLEGPESLCERVYLWAEPEALLEGRHARLFIALSQRLHIVGIQ